MGGLVIVDSGSANLRSISKAAEMVSLEPVISNDPKVIERAEAIIFPGVGYFDHAVEAINRDNLADSLRAAIAKNIPFLGICLGMQLLLTESEESKDETATAKGLDAISGRVKLFPDTLHVPHVGWNQVRPLLNHPLFNALDDGTYFYFTHSYYAQPDRKDNTLALTDYGFSFTSAVISGNIMGVQFHPEKSGPAGLRLLSNFGKIIADQI